jgi:hypothetical protein
LVSKPVATVSPGLALKLMLGFLVEPQNQGGEGFPGLGLKIGSSDLMICASKSLRLFLGLCLKIMWALICRLRHTYQDLLACFAWKQACLEFPSLT